MVDNCAKKNYTVPRNCKSSCCAPVVTIRLTRGGEVQLSTPFGPSRNSFHAWNQKYCAPHFWRRPFVFTKTRKTKRRSKSGTWGKEELLTDRKTAAKLRKEYPNHVPVKVAASYLGVSYRQLSWLVAEGREPYASIGGNIGTRQRYIRIYTEPLIALLSEQNGDF